MDMQIIIYLFYFFVGGYTCLNGQWIFVILEGVPEGLSEKSSSKLPCILLYSLVKQGEFDITSKVNWPYSVHPFN